jgi:hypothetical protein
MAESNVETMPPPTAYSSELGPHPCSLATIFGFSETGYRLEAHGQFRA